MKIETMRKLDDVAKACVAGLEIEIACGLTTPENVREVQSRTKNPTRLEVIKAMIRADLKKAGAAAVGFNCVAADEMTPSLVSRLRRELKGPLICKPNAGNPIINAQGIAEYPMEAEEFSRILLRCRENGAQLLGGCCGTDPDFLAAIRRVLST